MVDYLSKEVVNKGRQKELDLAKGIAIILMVFCHVGIYMFPEGSREYILTDLVGCEFAAPVFMVCLGVGTVYSRHNEIKDLIKRGLTTLMFGYLLNIVRETIPAVVGELIGHPYTVRSIYLCTTLVDIMAFAGMAFLTIALFKKLKLNPVQQFMISLVGVGLGELLAWHSLGNEVLDSVFGLIWGTNSNSYFPLLNWMIFPSAGVLFGNVLLHCNDKTKLYKSIFLIGLFGVALAYFQIFTQGAAYYGSTGYYFMGLKNVVYALCFPITLFSICQYIADKTIIEDLPIVGFCSKYLNSIYCVSWVIILWTRYICYDLLAIDLSYVIINIMMFAVLIVSYLIVKIYVYSKSKKVS